MPILGRMMPPDREAKTPRASGVWAIQTDVATAYITRLERAMAAKRAPHPIWYDPSGFVKCERLVKVLRGLREHFIAWQTDRILQAREQDALCAELREHIATAETILRAMPPKNGDLF